MLEFGVFVKHMDIVCTVISLANTCLFWYVEEPHHDSGHVVLFWKVLNLVSTEVVACFGFYSMVMSLVSVADFEYYAEKLPHFHIAIFLMWFVSGSGCLMTNSPKTLK
jgi:hypothetical protein